MLKAIINQIIFYNKSKTANLLLFLLFFLLTAISNFFFGYLI